MRHAHWLAAAASIAVGCAAQPEYFRPTERVTAEGTEGQPASSYDIRDGRGKLAEVTIWSDGAYRAEVRDQERTVVHVGFRVENLSDAPIVVDRRDLRLEGIAAGSRILPEAAPFAVSPPDLRVPPATARTFEAHFMVPRGYSPNALDSFRVRWSVLEQGRRYLQFTPFVEDERYAATYVPMYVYYDPWLYDPYYRYPIVHRPSYVAPRRVVVREHPRRR